MSEKTIVKVDHASIRFNLAMQKNVGMKDYLAGMLKKERRFQEFFALKDVSLEVKAGEAWGFVGRNGSGKSTLLKMITGILRPYSGQVYVDGNIAPLLELGAGFDAELTGRENIYMNGLILGMSKEYITRHFDEIVAFSELEQFLDVPVKNYSSGMKSRLGFAVATSVKPDILIADEVLAAGDKNFHEKCNVRMQELLSEGTTLLFVSHSAKDVQRLCSHALWLDQGEMTMMGGVDEVLSAYEAVK